jgi:hypothetical protein
MSQFFSLRVLLSDPAKHKSVDARSKQNGGWQREHPTVCTKTAVEDTPFFSVQITGQQIHRMLVM